MKKEYWWNELPKNKRANIKFEVCCIDYGQGDCSFTLISEKDLKKAFSETNKGEKMSEYFLWYYCDPLPIIDKVPIERQVHFTNIKKMLNFISVLMMYLLNLLSIKLKKLRKQATNFG